MPVWDVDFFQDRMRTTFAEGPHDFLASAGPGVVIAYDAEGKILWIEIVNMSRRVRDEALRSE